MDHQIDGWFPWVGITSPSSVATRHLLPKGEGKSKIGGHEAAGLPLPQARVQAVARNQLGMGAGFHDFTAIHNHQPIHACDRGKAMGNGDDRLAFHQDVQAVLDGGLHFRIQR